MQNKRFNRFTNAEKVSKWRSYLLFLCFLILSFCFVIYAYAGFSNSYRNSAFTVKDTEKKTTHSGNKNAGRDGEYSAEKKPESQQFCVYFIDVGQGDSSLIQCGDHFMLIDGGSSRRSDLIYSFLKERGISHLDYIVATHPDDDHIGGLIGALNFASVGVALSPVIEDDSESFRNFRKYLDRQGVEITIPKAGAQYLLGTSTIMVLGPTEITDNDNNNSIVLKVEHGDYSFLFGGDAEKEEENMIISSNADLKSTVLKIGHHGSASSTSDDWLSAVSPVAAVISCGSDNEYGHPTEEVLELLKKQKVQVFRTDLQGDITFFEAEDGLYYAVEKNPEADVFVPGTAASANTQPLVMLNPDSSESTGETELTRGGPADNSKNEMTYIVNVNTGVFHYIDCRGVRQMKESNKKYVTCDRKELLNQGYKSCGICHP